MPHVHATSLPLALQQPRLLGLPAGHTIQAVHIAPHRYTLIVQGPVLRQLATGLLSHHGVHVEFTPAILETQGLSHLDVPDEILAQIGDLPPEPEHVQHLKRHLEAGPPVPLAEVLHSQLVRCDPHASLRDVRARVYGTAQVRRALRPGQVLRLPNRSAPLRILRCEGAWLTCQGDDGIEQIHTDIALTLLNGKEGSWRKQN